MKLGVWSRRFPSRRVGWAGAFAIAALLTTGGGFGRARAAPGSQMKTRASGETRAESLLPYPRSPATPTGISLSLGGLGLRGSGEGRQLFQRAAASGALAVEATYDVLGGERHGEKPAVAVGLGGFFESEKNVEVAGYSQHATLDTYSVHATGLVRLPVGPRLWPYLALSGGVAFARAGLGSRPLVGWASSAFGRAALGLRVVVATQGALQVAVGAEGGMIAGTSFDFSVAPAESDDQQADAPIATAPVHLGKLPNLRGYGGLHLVVSF